MKKLLFMLFPILLCCQVSLALTKPCLYGHITILTEDGRKPSREKIPLSITQGYGAKNNKGHANTNKEGFFCIDHSVKEGEEVSLSLGEKIESETKQPNQWSSWKILSPYNGKINIPDNSNHSALEVIIVPSSFYHVLLLDSPPDAVLGKNCKNIYKFPHLQVKSFKTKSDAEIEKTKLVYNGFQACVSSKYIKNRKWHRVLVTVGSKTPLEVCNDLKINYGYKECIIYEP